MNTLRGGEIGGDFVPVAASKIVELRSLLAEKFPTPVATARQTLPTGFSAFDAVLGGGLPRGALTEVVRPASGAGATLLLHQVIAGMAAAGGRVALVDGHDGFDVDDFENETLRRLLWVRCKGAEMATKAADWLLRDGNLPLSIVDLTGNSAQELRKIPASTWHRLARATEDRGLACLVLSPQPMVASATNRLELAHRFTLKALGEPRLSLTAALSWRWLRRRGAWTDQDNIIAFPRASAAA